MISWEWLGGFFDGEGWAGIIQQEGRKPQYRANMAQKHRIVLEAIQAFLASHGITTGLYYHKSTNSWQLDIVGQKDVTLFLEQIESYLVIKKEKVIGLEAYWLPYDTRLEVLIYEAKQYG